MGRGRGRERQRQGRPAGPAPSPGSQPRHPASYARAAGSGGPRTAVVRRHPAAALLARRPALHHLHIHLLLLDRGGVHRQQHAPTGRVRQHGVGRQRAAPQQRAAAQRQLRRRAAAAAAAAARGGFAGEQQREELGAGGPAGLAAAHRPRDAAELPAAGPEGLLQHKGPRAGRRRRRRPQREHRRAQRGGAGVRHLQQPQVAVAAGHERLVVALLRGGRDHRDGGLQRRLTAAAGVVGARRQRGQRLQPALLRVVVVHDLGQQQAVVRGAVGLQEREDAALAGGQVVVQHGAARVQEVRRIAAQLEGRPRQLDVSPLPHRAGAQAPAAEAGVGVAAVEPQVLRRHG